MSQTDLGKLHQNELAVDYEKLSKQYQAVMEQIRVHESD
jgi:hypothetical protein